MRQRENRAVCRCVRVIACLGLATTIATPLPAQDPLRNLATAWQSRQDKIDSARFEYTETRTDLRGSLSEPGSISVDPADDHTYDSKFRLLVDGQKSRYDRAGPVYFMTVHDYRDRDHSTSFDGIDSFIRSDMDGNHPQGKVLLDEQSVGLMGNMDPLCWCIRPCDRLMGGFLVESFALSGQTGQIGESKCLVVIAHRGQDSQIDLWVDPERDYIILRYAYTEFAAGRSFKIDCQWQPDDLIGWVPAQWEYVSNNMEGPAILSSVLSAYELNPALDQSEFRLKFGPGTIVSDQKRHRRYLVRQDGTERVLLAHEIGIPYEQLLASEGMGTASWPIYVIGVLAILAIAWLVVRRKAQLVVKPKH